MLEGTKIVLSSLQQSLRYVFLSTLFCALLRTSHKKNTTGPIIFYSLKWAGFFLFFLGGGGGGWPGFLEGTKRGSVFANRV